MVEQDASAALVQVSGVSVDLKRGRGRVWLTLVLLLSSHESVVLGVELLWLWPRECGCGVRHHVLLVRGQHVVFVVQGNVRIAEVVLVDLPSEAFGHGAGASHKAGVEVLFLVGRNLA